MPQVQKIILSFEDDTALSHISLACPPFNITLQDGNKNLLNTTSLFLHRNTTEADIEQVFNSMEAIQSVGRIRTDIDLISLQKVVFVLVFSTRFGVHPSEVPVFKLDSDTVALTCSETVNNTQFSVYISLLTFQTLTYINGFNLTLGHPRYTPYLAINISSGDLKAELDELLAWQCVSQPPTSQGIVVNDSYEADVRGRDANAPRAFCGHRAERSPTVVWESGNGLELNPSYVS